MAPHSSRTGISSERQVGDVVRARRKAAGLTQVELAGLAGTGTRYISDLERGKPTIAMDKLLAVLAVLGLRLQIVPVDG